MTWNHRIVRYRDGSGYGLHEIYYNDDGQPTGMTEKPVGFDAALDEGPQSLIAWLASALADATASPVIDEPETWAPPDD